MKIGAYSFAITGQIEANFARMKAGIEKAYEAGVQLLLFPECAVTGYPPHCVPSASQIDYSQVNLVHQRLQALSFQYQMHIIAGSITPADGKYRNTALVFFPDGKTEAYCKRALWGYDRENFIPGIHPGVFEIGPLKVGVRICFEVRFPEYFRELYREKTDLNLILFYDRAEQEDLNRYSLIRGHIQTRAVENVCCILSCNTCSSFQTAPTAVFDRSGKAIREMERGKEGLLTFDYEKTPLSFGEKGRKEISDSLVK